MAVRRDSRVALEEVTIDAAVVNKLTELARAASTGPWRHIAVRSMQHEIYTADDVTTLDGSASISCWHAADAEFVVAASPDVILHLLDERATMVAVAEQLRGALRLVSAELGEACSRMFLVCARAGMTDEDHVLVQTWREDVAEAEALAKKGGE